MDRMQFSDLPLDVRDSLVKLIIELLSEHLLSTSFDDTDLNQTEFEADQQLSFAVFQTCFYEILHLMSNYDASLLKSLLTIVYEGSVLDPVENLCLMKIVTIDKTYLPICNIISRGCLDILFSITEMKSSLFLTDEKGNAPFFECV
jgi:hypothetical protein